MGCLVQAPAPKECCLQINSLQSCDRGHFCHHRSNKSTLRSTTCSTTESISLGKTAWKRRTESLRVRGWWEDYSVCSQGAASCTRRVTLDYPSLSLSFLICKMGIKITVPTPQVLEVLVSEDRVKLPDTL